MKIVSLCGCMSTDDWLPIETRVTYGAQNRQVRIKKWAKEVKKHYARVPACFEKAKKDYMHNQRQKIEVDPDIENQITGDELVSEG